MNVFDWDKTIYNGDSTAHFLMFLLRKQPSLVRFFPGTGVAFLKYALKLQDKTAAKQHMFRMFAAVDDMDGKLSAFWDGHLDGVMDWYKSIRRADDIVISASPEFLVRAACSRLGIENVIGSPVDRKTGRYGGKNCHGEEKVRVWKKAYPDAEMDAFYSDSLSDAPLAGLAKEAFIIRNGRPEPWPEKRQAARR